MPQGARGEVLGVPGGQGRRTLGPSGFKGYVRGVPGGQGGGLRCPIGSTATFDGSSDLKDPKGSRGMFRGPRGSRGARGGSIRLSRESNWASLMGFLMIHKAYMPVYVIQSMVTNNQTTD